MLTKKEVAERLGMKGSALTALLNGRCGISRSRAADMERITGIDRIAWLYPADWDLHTSLEKWVGDEINRGGRGRVRGT